MRNKHMRSDLQQFSILTPWETDIEDTCINKYCSDFVQKNILPRTSNLPKIPNKKRAISTCNNNVKNENLFNTQKNIYNKTHYQSIAQNQPRPFHTISQNKTDRIEKRKTESRGPLQQVSVKNFIIEGGKSSNVCAKQKNLKKRQSSYILKQKFAEFRRSVRTIGQNKQNSNMRVIRYDS